MLERPIGKFVLEMQDREMERKGWEQPMYLEVDGGAWTARDPGFEHGDEGIHATMTFDTIEAAEAFFDAEIRDSVKPDERVVIARLDPRGVDIVKVLREYRDHPTGGQEAPKPITMDQLREDIAGIIESYGESFIDIDAGVDLDVCQSAASEIMEQINKMAIKVMVAVRGGLVQGALSDLPNVKLEVHDFDEFDGAEKNQAGRTEAAEDQLWEDAQAEMYPIY